MPIYEYECRRCNAHVEVMQKMTDKPLLKCTSCGGRLEKQWSSTSFQLKGTGWYATDYAVKTSEVKPETKDGTSAPQETSSKADEKPAKGDDKSGAAKTEKTTSDKPATVVNKNTSKNGSSGKTSQ